MKFIKDVILNLVSNFFLLFVLQILLYPNFGQNLDTVSFGLFLTIIGVVNLISISFSSAYINLYMKRFEEFTHNFLENLYLVTFLKDMIKKYLLSSLLVLLIFYFLTSSWLVSLIVTLYTIVMAIRLFLVVKFRVDLNYKNILKFNVFLSLLYLVLVLLNLDNLVIIFIFVLLVELLISVLIYLSFDFKIKGNLLPKFIYNRDILNLVLMSLFGSASGYLDRVAINILFGPIYVPLYYAATLTLKLFSQPLNVLSTVIFSYIAKIRMSSTKIKAQILTGLPIITIITFVLGLLIGPYFINLVYPQYLEGALKIYIPVNVALSLSVPVYILRSFIIKYYDTKLKRNIEFISLIIYVFSIAIFYIFLPKLEIIAYAFAITLLFKNIVQIYYFIKIKI